MAMQELNQTEVAEVSGAALLGDILRNLSFTVPALPIFALGLIGAADYSGLINAFYGNPG